MKRGAADESLGHCESPEVTRGHSRVNRPVTSPVRGDGRRHDNGRRLQIDSLFADTIDAGVADNSEGFRVVEKSTQGCSERVGRGVLSIYYLPYAESV